MALAEELFNSCSLEIVIPESLADLPDSDDAFVDSWLDNVQLKAQRDKVFFDERLEFFLLVRFKHDSLRPTTDSPSIPGYLLTVLSHLQASVEATYISPTPQHPQNDNSRLSLPPARSSSSAGASRPTGLGVTSPQKPPETPHPTPKVNEADAKYVYSEGTLLKSTVWGEDPTESDDSFRLKWSKEQECWIAIYRFSVTVAFIRTNINDPLLCLTTSITLRDKKLPFTPQRRILFDLLEKAGTLPPLVEPPQQAAETSPADYPDVYREDDFEEVNLLEGLTLDLPSESRELFVPSTRLPSYVRKSYALPPILPSTPMLSLSTPASALPVLRKSYRKTLATASGFHVRMRTVFVPQIALSDDLEASQAAGNEESTVVLCVEVENSGESGAGFSVDRVDISVGGEGAKITMIGWGERGFTEPTSVFPILIHSAEQYNLLYAVSFFHPARSNVLQTLQSPEFQRPVTINIIGRPFLAHESEPGFAKSPESVAYATKPFLSRWNCLLDLTPRHDRDSTQFQGKDSLPDARIALPYPSTPFPPSMPQAPPSQEQSSSLSSARSSVIAGSKKLVSLFSGARSDSRPSSNLYQPPGKGNLPSTPAPADRSWSENTPSPPLPPIPGNSGLQPSAYPTTPSYPSYPSDGLTPRPQTALPSFGQMSSVMGPNLTARQDIEFSTLQRTKGAGAPNGFASSQSAVANVILSVSVVPISEKEDGMLARHLTVHDEFALEIFIFNQSSVVCAFEVSYVEGSRRRDTPPNSSMHSSKSRTPSAPPFTPLESQIKIGPLAPSACQTVRMKFLALRSGVHSIDGLLITELRSRITYNLRSIMDIAIL